MEKKDSYLSRIWDGVRSSWKGMTLTGKKMRGGWKNPPLVGIEDPEYFKRDQGHVTIEYPAEKLPVPDVGRYRLHMETDDCIACDKCARICPVDCITIESFRAAEDLGTTSDGSKKRLQLPVFDIDMGKCMFCGLCTTDCPTECLTMTKVYDFSEFDRDNLVYHFGALSPEEELEKRAETDKMLAEQKAAKAAASPKGSVKKRPVLRRKPATTSTESPETDPDKPKTRPKPVRRKPVIKSNVPSKGEPKDQDQEKPKKRVRPVMNKKTTPDSPDNEPTENTPAPKKRPRPVMKKPGAKTGETDTEAPEKPKRPRPVMKKPTADSPDSEPTENTSKPKKRPRPVMKKPGAKTGETDAEAPEKPKRPRPVMKKPTADSPDSEPTEDKPKPKKRPRPIMKKPKPEDES